MLRKSLLILVVLVVALGSSTLLVSASMSGATPETPADFSCTDVTEIPQVECEALVALYNGTNGANWSNNQGWLVTYTPCSWYGVSCYEGHVESLYLPHNWLSGSIPPELGNLGNLAEFALYDNQLTGSIPPQLGNLGNLQGLVLGTNQLTGSIPPELGNLVNLRVLALGNNQLTESIPPELGNLGNLGSLNLSSNLLTGSIPLQLGNLGNLHGLNLSGNQLTGSIPPELGNLSSLDSLQLYSNQLTGSIPPWLGNLSNLIGLYLYNNQLAGSIPPQLGNLDNLVYLNLSRNQLTGSIPPWLGNLSNLNGLILYNNQLAGSIPPELSDLVDLRNLHVNDNMLSGSLPLALSNLTWLQSFYFYNTDLCEPDDSGFQAWLATISNVQRTGEVCTLTLAKNAVPDSVNAGEILTYTLSLQNLVTDTVFSSVSLNDTLPVSVTLLEDTPPASSQVGNILTWDVGSIGIGEGYTVTLRVQTPITPTQLVNQADVWAATGNSAQGHGSTINTVTDHALYISDLFYWADFNGDGVVDVFDLTMIASCWNLPIGGMCRSSYDTNNTGQIDIGDIMRVAGAWAP